MQRHCKVNPRFGIMQVQHIYQLCLIGRHYVDTVLMLQKDGKQVACVQLIGLMTLLIQGGDDLLLLASGLHAEEVITHVERFLSEDPTETK